jgi:hypothetical protein
MTDRLERMIPSTPQATAAIAQGQEESSPAVIRNGSSNGQVLFRIGDGVHHGAHVRPHQKQKGDPLFRPLRIYTLDPSASRLHGAIAQINVPYEPLEPGPRGSVLEVDNYDGAANTRYRQVDLDDPFLLMKDGRDPSPSDPMFHQSMCYAVCSTIYGAFRSALGRDVSWGFDTGKEHRARLRIRPHGFRGENAFYDKERGELCFGYYKASDKATGRNLPGGWVFTCLSHDIVAHEMTHAVLDGLRAHFIHPSGADVVAFHEAFADLVAIFQHFGYKEVVQAAIRQSQGNLRRADLLGALAEQFGHTTGSDRPLRTAIDVVDESATPLSYRDAGVEPHRLGSVLASAVFEAFTTIFKRKTERYVRLASDGRGILPPGELPADLSDILAKEASQLAAQFLNICIRAIDYCPPVDLWFGDFLRAVITADSELVADDPWAYREAWIDAFRRRGIYPRHVASLSEDALVWRPPVRPIPTIKKLSFAELKFAGDPGHAAGEEELRRQATVLAQEVCRRDHLSLFGLAEPGEYQGDLIEPPCVQSVRSSRRAGPDGQIAFDLVAEITQRRRVRDRRSGTTFDFFGGATVILDPNGDVRYAVLKNVLSEERLRLQRDFMAGDTGRRFWRRDGNALIPEKQLFKLAHETT